MTRQFNPNDDRGWLMVLSLIALVILASWVAAGQDVAYPHRKFDFTSYMKGTRVGPDFSFQTARMPSDGAVTDAPPPTFRPPAGMFTPSDITAAKSSGQLPSYLSKGNSIDGFGADAGADYGYDQAPQGGPQYGAPPQQRPPPQGQPMYPQSYQGGQQMPPRPPTQGGQPPYGAPSGQSQGQPIYTQSYPGGQQMPPQGYPPQQRPPQQVPPGAYPPQQRPPQQVPPQGYSPQQRPPPQQVPPNGYPPQQRPPPQQVPPQQRPPQMPPQGYPQGPKQMPPQQRPPPQVPPKHQPPQHEHEQEVDAQEYRGYVRPEDRPIDRPRSTPIDHKPDHERPSKPSIIVTIDQHKPKPPVVPIPPFEDESHDHPNDRYDDDDEPHDYHPNYRYDDEDKDENSHHDRHSDDDDDSWWKPSHPQKPKKDHDKDIPMPPVDDDCDMMPYEIAGRRYRISSKRVSFHEAQKICSECARSRLADVPNVVVRNINSSSVLCQDEWWIGSYDGGQVTPFLVLQAPSITARPNDSTPRRVLCDA